MAITNPRDYSQVVLNTINLNDELSRAPKYPLPLAILVMISLTLWSISPAAMTPGWLQEAYPTCA
jgi:hypothetical protein